MQTTRNEDTDPKKKLDETVHESVSGDTPIIVPDNEATKAYTADLAFMNEEVEVMVLPTQDRSDTTRLVTVQVNGKAFHFLRGEWRVCPRFVLEIIARSKRENWSFSYKKNSDGSTADINQMHQMLRYPHQYRDKNPKGAAWYELIRNMSY